MDLLQVGPGPGQGPIEILLKLRFIHCSCSVPVGAAEHSVELLNIHVLGDAEVIQQLTELLFGQYMRLAEKKKKRLWIYYIFVSNIEKGFEFTTSCLPD